MADDGDIITPTTPYDYVGDAPAATSTTFKLKPTSLASHLKGHPRTMEPAPPPQSSRAEKWKQPTILVLTISVALGIAMMIFLMWVAYRKVKKLRQLRRREMAHRA